MATFTITTPVNIDSLAGKTGGDTYAINGGELTVDQHSRYGVNQSTSASMGPITLSPTLGGRIEFNATKVRLVPYASGSGNVPAYGTVITQGSASGKLAGVYAALNVAPTTPGSAMPASGYVLLRQWNDVAFAAGALSGIGASATGPDQVGWLEIVGDDTQLATVGRLNEFKVRGAWFDFLGATTSGTRATTYQIPSNGTPVYLAGVWVETGVGTGTYEFYPCAGNLSATAAILGVEARRGKVCWIDTTGALRFGHDGANSTGGYCPPAGCRLRVPNLFFVCCTTAARTTNVLPNATPGTRMEFATTNGGVIDLETCCMNWYCTFSQAYSVRMVNVALMTWLVLSEIAQPVELTHVGVGHCADQSMTAFSMTACPAGGTITDCVWTRSSITASSTAAVTLTGVSGLTVVRETIRTLRFRTNNNSSGAIYTQVFDSTWTDCAQLAGRYNFTTCARITFTNTTYVAHPATFSYTPATWGHPAFIVVTACSAIMIDGVTWAEGDAPWTNILNVAAADCEDITLRNVGTPSAPLHGGTGGDEVVPWSRVTTVATVTRVAHGLQVGDYVEVRICDVTAAIPVGAKAITAVTADTFSFACTSSGATSGTLTYRHVILGYLVGYGTAARGRNVRVQRVYVKGARQALLTGDNANYGLLLDCVQGDSFASTIGNLLYEWRTRVRNCDWSGSLAPTVGAGVYGTHWADAHLLADGVAPVRVDATWTRVTTVLTVTSPGHKLHTGAEIVVVASSNPAALLPGRLGIIAVTADTFTVTCPSAGATSGTLTFEVPTSFVMVYMTEPTAETTDQCEATAGTPAFTSAGTLMLRAIGDQVTWTLPYALKSPVSFAPAEVVLTVTTPTNYLAEYALDRGSGFGAWKNLQRVASGAAGTTGQFTVTVTDTTGVEVDDYVFGTGIGYLARVQSVDSGTQLTLTVAHLATVSGLLRFNALPGEAAIGDGGVGLKVRLTATAANTNAISYLRILTTATAASRARTYPLDLATLTLTGLKNPSEVRVFAAGTTTEVPNTGQEVVAGGTYSKEVDVGAYPAVDISILALGYQNTRLLNITIPASGLSIPVQQVLDRQYANA